VPAATLSHAEREARRRAARVWTSPKFDPPRLEEFNRLGLDYDAGLPDAACGRPVIDCHSHLLAARHADDWFAAADRFGIDHTITMTPLEEVIGLLRSRFADRLTFIATPAWQPGAYDASTFWPRVEGYRNLGSRVVKFHLAPGTMQKSGLFLGSDRLRDYVDRTAERGMIVMTHIGDPQAWYDDPDRYGGDPDFWGTRERHYDAWEALLDRTRGHPWWGAHLGGWPENLDRLRHLLTTYPDLMLDLSATRWMVREVSLQRDAMRDFVIAFQDRLMWGSDQVSGEGRGFDFFASRWWCHRKLWESDYDGESPIYDPAIEPPILRGLDLPAGVLEKLYRTNVRTLLARVGL
jgi:hypothetical protein